MATSQPNSKIRKIQDHPGWQEYKALGKLPMGAVPFTFDDEGLLLYTPGEVECRVGEDYVTGEVEICGAQLSYPGHFNTHFKIHHYQHVAGMKHLTGPIQYKNQGKNGNEGEDLKRQMHFFDRVMLRHKELVANDNNLDDPALTPFPAPYAKADPPRTSGDNGNSSSAKKKRTRPAWKTKAV